MYLILFIAYFEELQCIGLCEGEGFSDEHAEEILEYEGIERGEFYVCFEFFEGVAVVLHSVGQQLSQLDKERGRWLGDWLWFKLCLWRLRLGGCFLEIRSILLLLMEFNLKSLGLNSFYGFRLLYWLVIII